MRRGGLGGWYFFDTQTPQLAPRELGVEANNWPMRDGYGGCHVRHIHDALKIYSVNRTTWVFGGSVAVFLPLKRCRYNGSGLSKGLR